MSSTDQEVTLPGGIIGPLAGDPVETTGRQRSDVLAELRVPDPLARCAFLAAGLPDAASGDPMRGDDVELPGLVAEALAAGLPEAAALRCLRVFGTPVPRIADRATRLEELALAAVGRAQGDGGRLVNTQAFRQQTSGRRGETVSRQGGPGGHRLDERRWRGCARPGSARVSVTAAGK
jgi:hypothetical protein